MARLLLLLIWAVWWLPAAAVSVAFVNPGRSNEAYWVAAAEAMQQAALALDLRLEVHYAEREHLKALQIVRGLVDRPPELRPDYVVFSNDYATGAEILRLLEGSGIRAFMAFSALHGRDREVEGRPREKHPEWIGSLEPKADDAGYMTARELIRQGRLAGAQGPDGKLHLLALAGDRSTPSSAARNAGLRRALAEADDVVLDQMVYANWSRPKAAEKARWLYARHPGARLVWAGSDQMAFGAMQAWRERGGQPGRSAWFSGINTSAEALAAVRSGELSALAGGHFLAGAWALVMIHDYARGRDFADGGTEWVAPMFQLLDRAAATKFEERFGPAGRPIDFRRYSRALNPGLSRYDFEFSHLLR